MNNELVLYGVLKQRAQMPDLAYGEFLEAAKEVVAGIAPEEITPIEEMLNRIESQILKRRKVWDLNFFLGSKGS